MVVERRENSVFYGIDGELYRLYGLCLFDRQDRLYEIRNLGEC